MVLCSEAKWNEMASAHAHGFVFPHNGVAAFELFTGTSPWLMPGNCGTVQESARGCQLKPCQAVCGQLGSVDGPRGVLKPVPSPGIIKRRSCRAADPGSWGMGYIQKLWPSGRRGGRDGGAGWWKAVREAQREGMSGRWEKESMRSQKAAKSATLLTLNWKDFLSRKALFFLLKNVIT